MDRRLILIIIIILIIIMDIYLFLGSSTPENITYSGNHSAVTSSNVGGMGFKIG